MKKFVRKIAVTLANLNVNAKTNAILVKRINATLANQNVTLANKKHNVILATLAKKQLRLATITVNQCLIAMLAINCKKLQNNKKYKKASDHKSSLFYKLYMTILHLLLVFSVHYRN